MTATMFTGRPRAAGPLQVMWRWCVWGSLALGGHGLVLAHGLWVAEATQRPRERAMPVEVVVLPRPSPAAVPEHVHRASGEETPLQAPKPRVHSRPRPGRLAATGRRARSRKPRPARASATLAPKVDVAKDEAVAGAGRLLTRAEGAGQADSETAVRFVTDAQGQRYGSGAVARGGQHMGTGSGRAVGRRTSAGPVGGGTASGPRWTRPPKLAATDACQGYFPAKALSTHGSVALLVVLRADGRVTRAQVELETPAGQGFGEAARRCLLAQRFEPALNGQGQPVAARTRVRLRFAR